MAQPNKHRHEGRIKIRNYSNNQLTLVERRLRNAGEIHSIYGKQIRREMAHRGIHLPAITYLGKMVPKKDKVNVTK